MNKSLSQKLGYSQFILYVFKAMVPRKCERENLEEKWKERKN